MLTKKNKSGAFVVSGLGNRPGKSSLNFITDANSICKDRPAESYMVITTGAPDQKLYETRKV